MPHNHYRHVHMHDVERRQWLEDAWGDFTSAVAGAFGPQGKANNTPTANQPGPTPGPGPANQGQQNAGGQADTGNEEGPKTIFRTVFTTMTPEGFEGGPLTTLTPNGQTGAPKQTGKQTAGQTPATIPAQIVQTTPPTVATDLAVATGSPTLPNQSAEQISAQPSPTAGANSGSGGSDTAVKAGVAIGVLAGVFIIFALVYLAIRKRRKRSEQQQLDDDEKINGPFGSATLPDHGPPTPLKAPRLSLRPVTQFLPNLGNQSHPDRRASRGAAIAMDAGPQMTRPAPGGSPWERPLTSSSAHSINPFTDNARLNTPSPNEQPPVSPVSSVGTAMSTNSPPSDSPVNAAAYGAAGAGAGAVAGLSRKASIQRKDAPKALDLTLPPPLSAVPPSPSGTEFSMHSIAPGQSPAPSSSAAAIAAAGGPATSAVHRVQLDFKPTMEDEMELRAGQLVRLLHEYDDGWALCIRLDRSQQGVVPRTCLSTRPVKPRPAQGGPRGPPVNPHGGPHHGPGGRGPNYHPGQRPMTPQGGPGHGRPQSPAHGRPMSPYGQRPASPAGRPMSPGPRAMSPGPRAMSPGPRAMSPGPRAMSPGPRSQSPGPRYQPQGRPQSPNGMNRRMSPPGQSSMNQQYRPGPPQGAPQGAPIGRKPVPGQAY